MKKQNILILGILIIIIILFFLHPNILYYSAVESFNLFYDKIYLVLFPFLILGNILISYNVPFYFGIFCGTIFNKLFNINKNSAFLVILSAFTGFPTGALYINKLYQKEIISEDETIKLLSISFFPSPMFVISTIGSLLLKNKTLGILMLSSIYLTNILLGIIIRGKNIKIKSFINHNQNKSFGLILKDSIETSFNTLLLILGNITIFMIVSNIFFYYFKFNSLFDSILSGILEMTNGIQKLSALSLSNFIKFILISFTLSFSGLSIHSQVLSIVNNSTIYKKVFINRIFASFLNIIVSSIVYILISKFKMEL